MAEGHRGRPLKTVIAGRLVDLPGTIVAIRATTDADRATEFNREIEHPPPLLGDSSLGVKGEVPARCVVSLSAPVPSMAPR
ncbi:hypothetical protein [Streptomyces sp. NPDC056987]|uniref:hypothetical protein n=1 Tax=Streptomyces sp. NPDC056987 TaxID=3345988 RepID=UPI003625E15D